MFIRVFLTVLFSFTAPGFSASCSSHLAIESLLLVDSVTSLPVGEINSENEEEILVRVKRKNGKTKSIVHSNRYTFEVYDDYGYRTERGFVRSLRGKKALDIGCGGGAMVDELREKGIDIDGMDLALSAEARKKKYFFQGDFIGRLPPRIRLGSYDILLSYLSYFYYNSRYPDLLEAGLRRSHQLLKKGGKLLIHGVPYDLQELTGEAGFSYREIQKGATAILIKQ